MYHFHDMIKGDVEMNDVVTTYVENTPRLKDYSRLLSLNLLQLMTI